MKKMSNEIHTDIKPRMGRHYIYKEHEYVVIGFPMVKTYATNDRKWTTGVSYERVEKVGEQANKTFVRQAEDFLNKFVPIALEVGDIVEAISMGKSRGMMTVESIQPDDEYPVKFRNSDKAAKLPIDEKSQSVEVDSPDQATEYKYVFPIPKCCKDYYFLTRDAIMKMVNLLSDFQCGRCFDTDKDKIENIVKILDS